MHKLLSGVTEPRLQCAAMAADRYLIQISEEIPSLEECHRFVSDSTCGALASFVGITRDNFEGKKVQKLTYEGYVPMANKELHKICDETISKFPGVNKIAVVHILGDCPVGKASVIVAISSPHRKEAIHGIGYMIDELKARVPIWKREIYEGDDGVWKENEEWLQGQVR